MSKTISIPEYNNPFVVNINNKEYIYKAGAVIEVPDEVAEAIEDALELIPKPKRYLSKIAQLAEGTIKEIVPNDLDGITTITDYAFYAIKSLTNVTIPRGIATIGGGAFFSCTNLERVTFEGDSQLNYIKASVFDGCTNLESVFLPTKPPVLSSVNAFSNIKPTCTFYCKDQTSLDAYKAAPIWSTLTGTYSFVVEE